MQLGKRKEAMEYLKKAEKSGNRGAVKLLAGIYYESGDINKAINYYKKVLAGNKKDVDSMSKLGYIYKERGSYSEALKYFKRCLKYTSDYNEKKMIENELYYIKQNMPPAPASSSKAKPKAKGSDSEEAIEEAEDLYEDGMFVIEEDPEEAKKLFQEVMKTVSKDNEFYKKAQKALNKINAEESKKQKENEKEDEEE